MAISQINTNSIATGAVTAGDLADGSVTAAKLAAGVGGKVLQVVSATNSTDSTIGSTSYTDTGLSGSITPSSASSKILIIVEQSIYHYQNGGVQRDFYLNLMRDSTQLMQRYCTDAAGASSNSYYYAPLPAGFVWLDSPSTTSSVTYKTQTRTNNTANDTLIKINATSSSSSIVLMEIAA